MIMKKAFTLLEVIISITIFMILLIFLYKVLDQTKSSNKQFKTKESSIKYKNHLNSILVEDILERTDKIDIKVDNDKNSLIRFKSSNTYHNPFFNNITYMISSSNKLIRIESKDQFKLADTHKGVVKIKPIQAKLVNNKDFTNIQNLTPCFSR